MFVTFRIDRISSMNGYMYPPTIKACSIIGKSVRNNLPSGFSGTLLEVAPNILSGCLRPNTEYWFLTEDGLYEVLMQSRKPKAKEFKKEVKKILKSIRKHGGYVVGRENK